MSEKSLSGPDRFLIGLAVIADIATIISFLGIQPSSSVRWITIATLTLLGVTSSGFTLVTSVSRWYSPKGSLARPGYYSRRILVSFVALAISIVLGIILISSSARTAHNTPHPHTTNSPRTTSSSKSSKSP